MDKKMFSKEFTQLRKSTLIGRKQQNRTMFDAWEIAANEEEFNKCNDALIEILFQDAPQITLKDFISLKS